MRKRTVKWIWVMLASVGFILFVTLVLPWISDYGTRIIGDVDSPDESFIYSAKDLYAMAKSFGPSGRRNYILLRWTFDVIWPLVYTTFLVLWIAKLTSYLKGGRWVESLYFLPIAAMILDFIENIGATIVMMRYPSSSGAMAYVTPVATFLKWGVIFLSFGMVLILMVSLIYQRIRKVT